MVRSLWVKFLILLLGVSAIALSAALVLRELMVLDFRDYLEGEREDRVYWITADLERTYEKHGGWNREALEEDAVWALMLGFQTRITDASGRVVVETEKALASLSPSTRRRGLARLEGTPRREPEYNSYPLFLSGREFGTLEASAIRPRKEAAFIDRSNLFLLSSVVAMGGIAVVLSAIASRRLTRPLKRLSAAAASISEGDLTSRVAIEERDEIGRLAETFNRMAQELQTLEQLRKKLLTNVAHELRTPLGAMRAELEGMMDGLIPGGKEQLQSLHDETGRLKRMLDRMEDVAHAEASVVTIRKEPVRLEPLLKNIVQRIDSRAREKGVVLGLECADHLVANADPDKLSQIVLNVVDNAVKAVAAGGKVTVSAFARGAEMVVAVEDDGVGIAPADLPFIFERFYRSSEGGLGVGLAIVKELMEAHGGGIQVESEPGKGSVFTMHFPA
jgi:two-component system sensor histidine kinase BaeS